MDGHDINSLRGTKAVDPAADRYTAVVHRRSEAQEHPRGQAGRQTRYGIFFYQTTKILSGINKRGNNHGITHVEFKKAF